MPLSLLSFEGDDIHRFVQEKCNGKWPEHGSCARVTCNNPFPMIYYFAGFRRDWGEEASCEFQTSEDEPDPETVNVPLSMIKTFTSKNSWSRDTVLDCLNFDSGVDRKILVKLEGCPFEECILKDVLDDDVGPRLVLGKRGSFFQQTVYMGAIEKLVSHPKFVHKTSNLFMVLGLGLLFVLPVPSVVKMTPDRSSVCSNTPFQFGEIVFFGYSAAYGGIVYANFTKDKAHLQIDVKHISTVTFVREGVQ